MCVNQHFENVVEQLSKFVCPEAGAPAGEPIFGIPNTSVCVRKQAPLPGEPILEPLFVENTRFCLCLTVL